jgi:hypothetical protein
MTGAKTYWVAQLRSDVGKREAFRTRKDAVHFVDHRVEGWADNSNSAFGWTVFQCSAFAEWRP